MDASLKSLSDTQLGRRASTVAAATQSRWNPGLLIFIFETARSSVDPKL
jgi:hypothetical protein